jgi:hypothetical protein
MHPQIMTESLLWAGGQTERLRCLKEQFSVPCIKKDTTGELQRRKSGSERLTGKSV